MGVARRITAVLAALACTAGACAAGASARTPVKRPAAHHHRSAHHRRALHRPVRVPALVGVQSRQWKTWWGDQSYAGGGVTLSSRVPTSPAETHSSLITTKRTWQDSTISFATTTLRQLREGSAANPWEVGWVLFRFTDLENYYWFMLKTNGFELGKKQGSDTQIFLVTGALPAAAVGQERQIQVRTDGPRIQVAVDGQAVVDYTDPNPLGAGSVGLYEEDAQARFDSLSIS